MVDDSPDNGGGALGSCLQALRTCRYFGLLPQAHHNDPGGIGHGPDL